MSYKTRKALVYGVILFLFLICISCLKPIYAEDNGAPPVPFNRDHLNTRQTHSLHLPRITSISVNKEKKCYSSTGKVSYKDENLKKDEAILIATQDPIIIEQNSENNGAPPVPFNKVYTNNSINKKQIRSTRLTKIASIGINKEKKPSNNDSKDTIKEEKNRQEETGVIKTQTPVVIAQNSENSGATLVTPKEENTDNSTDNPINKNLILPTQTPGVIPTDIDRQRQYYNNLNNFTPKEDNSKKKDEVLTKIQNPLALPQNNNANEPTVFLKDVNISKSAVFSDKELENFKSLVVNKKVTATDLNNLIYIINSEYQKKHYITAKAFIPVSSLKGGVLHIELLEAKIGKITVKKNRFNRTFFIKSRLSQKEGNVLDVVKLENDLKRFNKLSNGVYLSAKLKPGKVSGTTDIIITASESFPLHLTTSYDDFGRDITGLQRAGIITSLDNVIGIQDKLTSGVNLSSSSVTSYTDYSIPIGKKGARIGASYMFGNTDISDGIYKDFEINSKTNVFSAYLYQPLIDKDKFSLSSNTSVNYKNSDSTINGFDYTKMNDVNLSVGLNGRYNFKNSILYSSQYLTNGIIENSILGSSNYFTRYNGDAFYLHYFKHGIVLTAKAGVQYVPQNVNFIEQSQIGGMSTVRGYSEGLFLGQTSYFGSLETLFPFPILPKEIPIPFSKSKKFKLRDNIKFATFVDHGAVFRHGEEVTNQNFLTSVGLGLRMSLTRLLTARMYWGFGLADREEDQPSARFHFDLISAPF